MNKKTYIHNLIVLLLLLILVSLIILIVLYFSPYDPIHYNKLPLRVLNENKTLKSGEFLIIEVDYCKYKDIIVEVNFEIIGDLIYILPPIRSNFPVGCNVLKLSRLKIPNLHDGEYKVRFYVSYKVNPLREIKKTIEMEEFYIKN